MDMHGVNNSYKSPMENPMKNWAQPNVMNGRFANHELAPGNMNNTEAAGMVDKKRSAEMMPDDMKMGTMAGRYLNEELVAIIQDCEAHCEHMTSHLRHHAKEPGRNRQARLLRDCADICGLTARYAARGAVFARQAAGFCAMVCETCGNECARFPDPMSQSCAETCLICADACRAFAGM